MELVEERFARRILDRPIREDELARLRRRSIVQGLLYAAAFCLVVLMTWDQEIEGASLLAIVVVLGCCFESGFLVATNRLAALGKIALYVLTVAGYFAVEVAAEGWSRGLGFQICAVAILGYLVSMFVIDVRGARRVQARAAAALAERGAALEAALADLTEKERAMRRFALAAEHANDSIVITGRDDRIEWVNGGFTARTGWTLADVSDRPSRLMADPANDPATLGALNRAIEARRAFRGQLRVWCRGDRWVWYDVSLTPLFSEDGRFESYISVERDISELKAREAELARQEAEMRRLAVVAEHARDAVVIYAPDGRIEWVNPGFTAQTGYEAGEVVGRMSGMLVTSDEDSVTLLRVRAAMAAERPVRAELRLARKDGGLFWSEVSLSPVHGRGRTAAPLHRRRARHLGSQGPRGGAGGEGAREPPPGAGDRARHRLDHAGRRARARRVGQPLLHRRVRAGGCRTWRGATCAASSPPKATRPRSRASTRPRARSAPSARSILVTRPGGPRLARRHRHPDPRRGGRAQALDHRRARHHRGQGARGRARADGAREPPPRAGGRARQRQHHAVRRRGLRRVGQRLVHGVLGLEPGRRAGMAAEALRRAPTAIPTRLRASSRPRGRAVRTGPSCAC